MRYIWIFLAISVVVSLVVMILAVLGIIPPIFFFVLFLPFVFTGNKKRHMEYPKLRACPRCGTILSGRENYCPMCGFRLRFEDGE